MRLLPALVLTMALAACASPRRTAHAQHGRVGSHGMVLVGDRDHAFLSHIPMFGAPHDIQLVLAGTLRFDDDASPSAGFSDVPYTFLPDRMSLDAVRAGTLKELPGRVFLGNFEAGGRPLPSRAHFVLDRVVYDRVLTSAPSAPGAREASLTYILFGSRAHAFAAHRIEGAPSFDEILAVELDAAGGPTDAELASGLVATVAHAGATRLGETHGPAMARGPGLPFVLTARRALSCLVGPDFDRPCP